MLWMKYVSSSSSINSWRHANTVSCLDPSQRRAHLPVKEHAPGSEQEGSRVGVADPAGAQGVRDERADAEGD